MTSRSDTGSARATPGSDGGAASGCCVGGAIGLAGKLRSGFAVGTALARGVCAWVGSAMNGVATACGTGDGYWLLSGETSRNP